MASSLPSRRASAFGGVTPQVLIVGGGPVGLVLAIELGRRGVRCVVVEQTDGEITFPTGESLSTRTMEHFRRLGLAQAVRFSGFPADYRRNVRFVTRVFGYQLTVFERTDNQTAAEAEARVSPESAVWCPKFFLDPLLQDAARAEPNVELVFGRKVTRVEQDASGVTATVDDETLRAEYLVGCDGGASTVRRSQGISLEGNYAEGHNLGVYFRAPSLLERSPYGQASQYWLVNTDARGPVSTVDGRERWRLSVEYPADQIDHVDPEHVVREALGQPDLPFEVLGVRPWAGHRLVADSYRRGRVFLAGDSAHLMWPRGGFGLNTGIGDAVDLAWKLAATLHGWGGPRLLDSYDLERRPVGRRNVNAAADNRAAEMAVPVPEYLEEDTPRGAAQRAEVAQVIERTRRKEWASLGIALGYRYDDSPVCVPDGSPPPSNDGSVYEPTSRPGSRAPHAWLADGCSTLDLLSRDGFTLLCFQADEPTALCEAARTRGVPLTVRRVDDDAVRRLYEKAQVLVRPDGHVAWRGDTLPVDPVGLIDRVRGAHA
jgi:2-polyprenyl-6-methoxyphenol hydroxylase-like FAD-dependent oxidoreductase